MLKEPPFLALGDIRQKITNAVGVGGGGGGGDSAVSVPN